MNTTMSFSFLVRSWLFALCVVMFTASISAAGPAQFVIVNVNAPGVGLNDPTAVAPVGGNTGTTLGEQRLIAFQHAASIWSARLDSTVPIRIRAQFTALPAGVLGSAAALALHANFPNAPLSNTWYPAALANKLAGRDLSASDDINANFSTNFNFYLGLDNNHGMQPDLVTTLLHEFAHGLGFMQYTNLTTGAQIQGLPDVYNRKLLDTTLGLHWPQMTNAERAASATNWRRVVWDGTYVTAGVPNVLSLGSPTVAVNTPASVAGVYPIGTADFGPAVGNPNVSAYVEAAVDPADAAGPTTTDGCSPLTNAAAVAGKIALIERGTCAFALKARNATNAGAVAAMIYNQAVNANASAPGMGDDGLNGAFVLIPTVSLRRVDGLAIVGQLGSGVLAEMFADLTLRAGADALNRARVFSPSPVAGGSSISHYDEFASRNLLMEPASTNDLTHKVKAPDDLTFELLRDLGWTFPDADGDEVADDEDCNPNSDRRPTIVIGAIDTSVPNHLFPTGCTSADLIAQLAAAATNHGSFVSAVAELTNAWVQDGIVTGWQKGEIQSVAARYRTP